MFKATVTVMLKKSVLDPQGAAVERSLKAHGHEGLDSVRIGKIMELVLDGPDLKSVEDKVALWADQFLANPVMETFSVKVEQLP